MEKDIQIDAQTPSKIKMKSNFTTSLAKIWKFGDMASSPITSWEIDGETVETVSEFIFLGSKITALTQEF